MKTPVYKSSWLKNKLFWAWSQGFERETPPNPCRRHRSNFLSEGGGNMRGFHLICIRRFQGFTISSTRNRRHRKWEEVSVTPTCGGVGVEEGWPTGGVEFLLPDPPAMISSVISLPPWLGSRIRIWEGREASKPHLHGRCGWCPHPCFTFTQWDRLHTCKPVPTAGLSPQWQKLQSRYCDGDKFFTWLGRKCAPVLFVELLATLRGVQERSAHLRSHHSISIGFKPGLWRSHSEN